MDSHEHTSQPLHRLAPLHGRGAVRNVAHRFQADVREPDAECAQADASEAGQEAEKAGLQAGAPVRTTVSIESARKLLSYNVSPDIPFDRAVNPYRGCEHGCTYCYARATHAYLGYSPGLDFETRLVVKANAVQALRAELARPGYRPEPITIGSATDAYQPIEREWRLARQILQLLDETSHPVVIITKNALVQRDIDILSSMAGRGLARVFVSITTLDAEMARTLEPRASAPWKRIEVIRKLTEAGIPTGVMVAPLIPFITDTQIEQVLAAAGQAGASSAGYTVLRLPHEVRSVFTEWLQAHFPDRAQRVLHRVDELNYSRDASGKTAASHFGSRMRGEGVWARMLAQRFALARRKAGLAQRQHTLDTTQFVAPSLNGQGQLF